MREYSGGEGCVTRKFYKDGSIVWQGTIRYRELDTGEVDESGRPMPGPWRVKTKNLSVPAYDDGDKKRGHKKALAEWRRWREQLVAEEPERAAREKAETDAAVGMVSASSTVAEYIDYYLNDWLPAARKGVGREIEPSTMAGYQRRAGYIAKAHGAVCIGDMPICELKRGDVVQFRNAMAKGYSPATVRDTLVLLNAALESAVYGEFIEKNPAEGVEAPAQRKHETTYLDASERARLLVYLDQILCGENPDHTSRDSRRGALGAKLALLTGMRQGEVCALRWRDVDLKRGIIHVRSAIGRTNEGYYEKATKSGSSRRDLFFDDENGLASDLAHRQQDMRAKLAPIGEELSDDAFVLGDVDGSYMAPNALYLWWKRCARRLELVTVCGTVPTFHDLRHTFGTVMAYGGCPEISLKNVMGHSEISTTHKYYVGVDTDADRIAMQSAMRRALRGVEQDPGIIEFRPTGTEG